MAYCLAASTCNVATAAPWELRDYLGRDWTNETVTYPLDTNELKLAKANRSLVGPEGKSIPYQVAAEGSKKPTISFQVNIPKFSEASYGFGTGAENTQSDLKVEESTTTIRLSNSRIGIALRKILQSDEGPIESIRLGGGQWVGSSQLSLKKPVQDYNCAIVTQGPVFVEVLARTRFEGGAEWRIRFRLEANEPAIIVSEGYSAGDDSSWSLDLSKDFNPEAILHRQGTAGNGTDVGPLITSKLSETGGQPAFMLEPWLHWSERIRQGNWMGLYSNASPDMLVVGALRPGIWIDPQKKNYANGKIAVTQTENRLQASWPLRDGVRNWLIASLNKEENLGFLKSADLMVAPPAQQLIIKHGDFPLNTIKDYVLKWPEDTGSHPRLLITQPDVERLRRSYKPEATELTTLLQQEITIHATSRWLRPYLASGDEKLGRKIAVFALKSFQDAVDYLTRQDSNITLGFAPHRFSFMLASIYLSDAVWTSALTVEERERLKAQMAFVAYTMARADYWSPERGYAANPNMTTSVRSYQVALGSMLKNHPEAKSWVKGPLDELRWQMRNWSDENGGWLEAPHYAMLAYDYLIGIFLMAHNAGMGDDLYDPKMKKIGEWFAQIATPPDTRVGGLRHNPPLGNTWWGEPSGTYGVLARLWKEKDPAFSARMQWMYREEGYWPDIGIGGFAPALAGYREILVDSSLPEKKPDYGTALFPETGAMLRNTTGERETRLYMIAGSNHAHYDNDSGSVTLWGKGRIIADDFGYQGAMPAADHNMIDSPMIREGMSVKEFVPTPHMDYLHARNRLWNRRVVFVKDSDPLAPNYFVIRDRLKVPAPATWRMWLSAEDIKINPKGALFVGKDDVDADIVFASDTPVALTTEDKTRETAGLDEKLDYKRVQITQTGLIHELKKPELSVLIFPRLKTQKPPRVTSLAEGKVLKVETEAGTDYVFLGDTAFTYEEGKLRFKGTVGLTRERDGKTELLLGAPGTLRVGDSEVSKPETAASGAEDDDNAIENGDMETGVALPYTSNEAKVALYQGNPGGEKAPHEGKYCLELNMPNANSVAGMPVFYIDRTKKYRVSFAMYSKDPIGVAGGGYALSQGDNLKGRDGQVWQYSLRGNTSPEAWKTLETTIGPPGSDAAYIWPEEAFEMCLNLWIWGKGTLYLDDFKFEPVKEP